jgi:hypothetical protein
MGLGRRVLAPGGLVTLARTYSASITLAVIYVTAFITIFFVL